MYCQHCGKPVAENALYCSNCGKRVNNEVIKTKDIPDIPVESYLKPKFSLLEFSLIKLLGFSLIISAALVIGSFFLPGASSSNALPPPFFLIPLVFFFGLGVVLFNGYNLVLVIGLTIFFLILYFVPNPLLGGFYWFARIMVAIYQTNEQRFFGLLAYSGNLLAVVTGCYLTIIGILSHKNFYSHSQKRGLIGIFILLGCLFLFTALPFFRKISAGAVSNTGVGGNSPGDIFLSSFTDSNWLNKIFEMRYDSINRRWAYEFKIENKRTDGKETTIEKIISNKGEIPLNGKNIKVQGALFKDEQIIIPLNIPIVLIIYSSEPLVSLRIHTDKLDADFLFIN